MDELDIVETKLDSIIPDDPDADGGDGSDE